jgi:hypothetical protein
MDRSGLQPAGCSMPVTRNHAIAGAGAAIHPGKKTGHAPWRRYYRAEEFHGRCPLRPAPTPRGRGARRMAQDRSGRIRLRARPGPPGHGLPQPVRRTITRVPSRLYAARTCGFFHNLFVRRTLWFAPGVSRAALARCTDFGGSGGVLAPLAGGAAAAASVTTAIRGGRGRPAVRACTGCRWSLRQRGGMQQH